MSTETRAQSEIRRDRDLATLSPQDRLEWHYASERKDPVEAKAEDSYSPAAKEWLGDRDLAALPDDSKELFRWLNTDPAFRRGEAAQPAPVPFEIDPAKVVGLSPTMKLEVMENFAIAKRGRDEERAGVPAISRRVQQGQVDRAMEFCRSFLRTAA